MGEKAELIRATSLNTLFTRYKSEETLPDFVALLIFIVIFAILFRTFYPDGSVANSESVNKIYKTSNVIADAIFVNLVYLLLVLIFVVITSVFLIFSGFTTVSKLIMLAGGSAFVIIFIIIKK